MDFKQQLTQLLQSLKELGTEQPNVLVSLTQVVQPQIPNELRIKLLGHMFLKIPEFFATVTSQQLQQLAANPPPEHVDFRLLLDLRQVQLILSSISSLQLLQLTDKALPPGSAQKQLNFLKRLQEVFQMWSNNDLDMINAKLTATPVHLARQVLLDVQPCIQPDLIHLLVELLKMPTNELLPFKQWIESLHETHLTLLVNLLQLEATVLIDLKRRLCGTSSGDASVLSMSTYVPIDPVSGPLGASWDAAPNPLEDDATGINLRSGSLELSYDTAARIGKRDRSGVAKEIVNIRVSGPVDPLIDPLMQTNGGGYYYDELEPHSKRIGATALSGPSLSASTSNIALCGDTMDTGIGGFDTGALEWDMTGTPTLMSSWGAVPNLNSSSGTAQMANSREMQVDEAGDTRAAPSTPTDHSGYLKPPISPTLSETPVKVTATPVPIPVPVPPLAPEFSLQQMQPQLQLRIAKQPPAKTVYQRILKPFPAVMLLGSAAADSTTNLFVEATLIRCDSDAELPLCLEGNRVIRISQGVFAVFKKLKILSTSQQQGTLFRLRFQLKRYNNNAFEVIPHAVATSNPIEVFSHTQYLTSRKGSTPPPPPSVLEVVPSSGPAAGGTRIAILGANFINSPQLRVKFGDVVIQCQFHESGTLLCTSPPHLNHVPGTSVAVEVRVSNDGEEYCQSSARFVYT